MIPKEIIKQIRHIEITTSRLVTDVFAGQYHSVFKGRGIEFDEVREYQVGDDVRSIDWNVTARTGRAHIKKFVEERELTVMILIDASHSNHFATVNELKNQLAAKIAAIFSFSAIRNNDNIGMIIFSDEIEKFIPPRKGKSHVLRMIREILFFKPKNQKTDITCALEYLSKVTHRRSVVFLISDFLDENVGALNKAMAIAHRRHDIIPITLNDPRESQLPDCGLLTLDDAETGRQVLIDSAASGVRERYAKQAQERVSTRKRLFDSLSMDYIDISTDKPYTDQLIQFFKDRKQRR